MIRQNWRSLKPAIPHNILARTRLELKLEFDSRAYWISAPAGFGKTVSTLHWLEKRNKHFIWQACELSGFSQIVKAFEKNIDTFCDQDEIYCVFDNAELLADNELMDFLPGWIAQNNYRVRPIIISRKSFPSLDEGTALNANLQLISASDLYFSKSEIKKIQEERVDDSVSSGDNYS
ncbi:MAG: hypothetical protein JKY24_05345, partial [Pseudomonadales bacterium]|nr:hypothetical protein [Pseudomonadales bacterium]